ncbi:hypothetical protein D3C87_1553410 [compost metagenome]
MQCHRPVEIVLGRTSLEADSEKLRHFTGLVAENMCAYNLAACRIDDQLHDHSLGAAGESRLHRAEFGAINFQLVITLGGFLFRKPDRANFRLRENSCRDQVIIRRGRIVAIDRLDETHGFVDCDRRQLYPVGDVAQRVDILHVGAGIFIDDDCTTLVGLHTGRLKSETLCVGVATECQHDCLDRKRLAAFGARRQSAGRRLGDFLDHVGEDDLDALLDHGLV